jgi:phosphoglycerate kinase
MAKLTIEDLEVAGKRVLTRVDFNVPLRDGVVTDDSRIVAALPTIRLLIDRGARVVLVSHLGRPKGEPDPKYSLEPVARRLAKLLGQEIRFVDDCIGENALTASERLAPGEVLLLENLRFHAEEEAGDAAFAAQLAQLGDVYVNDAFGAAHRPHASISGVTGHFRQAAAGLLLQRELAYLDRALARPERPFVAILGGAKISGKVDVIQNLLGKVDAVLIGGGMTYTFYCAQGIAIGDSLLETDRVEMAKAAMSEAGARGVDLILPVDSVISRSADGTESHDVTPAEAIPDGYLGVDIGPRTVALFRERISRARTVVWNGPLGIFEVPAFAEGTMEVARAVAEAGKRGGTTIVGGGDSVAAISRVGLSHDDFSHVSTGGGAFLEYLEGTTLPGVAALTDKEA